MCTFAKVNSGLLPPRLNDLLSSAKSYQLAVGVQTHLLHRFPLNNRRRCAAEQKHHLFNTQSHTPLAAKLPQIRVSSAECLMSQITNTGITFRKTTTPHRFIFISLRETTTDQPTMFQEVSQSAVEPAFLQKRRRVISEYRRTCRLDTETLHSVVHVLGTSLEANLNR